MVAIGNGARLDKRLAVREQNHRTKVGLAYWIHALDSVSRRNNRGRSARLNREAARGAAHRFFSMRKANDREQTRIAPYLKL